MSKMTPKEVIENAMELPENQFTPSPAMRDAKSRFWLRITSSPLLRAKLANDQITASAARQIIGKSSIETWWKKDGFKEWFLNEQVFIEKLGTFPEKILDIYMQVLDNVDWDNPKSVGNVLKAARDMAEMCAMFPNKNNPQQGVPVENLAGCSDEELKQLAGIVEEPE